MSDLGQEQLDEILDCFNFFDQKGDNKIDVGQVNP
jgi:Ca2+-binding EF-hand superfamily protein